MLLSNRKPCKEQFDSQFWGYLDLQYFIKCTYQMGGCFVPAGPKKGNLTEQKQTFQIEVSLHGGKQTKKLTIDSSTTGLQLKQRIYNELSQELKPQLMNLYLQSTKIQGNTLAKDLKSLAMGTSIRINQTKINLTEVVGLNVDPKGTDDLTYEQIVAKMPCGHSVGRDSIIQVIRSIIASKNSQIRCPYYNQKIPCQALWDFAIVKKIGVLTKAQMQELESGLALNKLEKDTKNCPQCGQAIVKINLQANHVVCPKCQSSFCYLCLNPWKTPIGSTQCGNKQQCKFYDNLLSICEMSVSFTLSTKEGVTKTRLTPKYRACTHCKTVIQYASQCKHMECTKCLNKFCWVCLAVPINGVYKCGGAYIDCGTVAGRQQIN